MPALIGNLDTSELLIVLIVAILIFGRRLPQVAAQAGRQVVKLRRSLDEAWRDTGMEREIREVRRNLEEAIPRDLSIGEMARIASAEMDKRVRANEEVARAESTASGEALRGEGSREPETRPGAGSQPPTKVADS